MDHFIRPYAENLPSFVKDTTDMILLIKSAELIGNDVLLVTFNVELLYTNVLHDRGLDAIVQFYEQQDPDIWPLKACILTLAEKELSLNYFWFEITSFCK